MLWVGIDTGVHTGFAVWDSTDKALRDVQTLRIDEALWRVLALSADYGDDLTVIVEDARQRRWVPDTRDVRKEMSRRLGAGSIKRDAKIWEDFLEANKIAYRMLPPRKGCTKLTKEAFGKLTGWSGRTTEHSRDAAMLVFGR